MYYPELHGIARAEELIGIPLWLISYKVKKSIYMIEVDAASGKIYDEWHPIKEPVNWRKTALIACIPLMIPLAYRRLLQSLAVSSGCGTADLLHVSERDARCD